MMLYALDICTIIIAPGYIWRNWNVEKLRELPETLSCKWWSQNLT